MNRNIVRISGVIVGLAFIGFGLILLKGDVPYVPSPEWIYGTVAIYLGVAFLSYGISGKSRILGIK